MKKNDSHAQDIRWQQRFANYQKALGQLQSAVSLSQQRELSELEQQGLIQAFEFTHELAWNVMKDYFAYQGTFQLTGSRDATREAFKQGLVTEGDAWMAMIGSRNRSSHTYHKETAREIVQAVTNSYCALFIQFEEKMLTLLKDSDQ